MVGNLITDGTTWKWITAFTSSTVVTVDSAPSWTSASVNVGGGLATVTKLAALMVASNKAWVQNGTYASATVITFGASGVTPSATVPATRIYGYNVTRGDIYPGVNATNRPKIQGSTASQIVLSFTNGGWELANLDIGPSGAVQLGSGISCLGGGANVINCKVALSNTGVRIAGAGSIEHCNISGFGSGGFGIRTAGAAVVSGCWVHDGQAGSSFSAIFHTGAATVTDCTITNVGGSGIEMTGGALVARRNTIYKCGADGIRLVTSSYMGASIKGNLLSENAGYGINEQTAGFPASPLYDGNAYYANTSGTRNNLDDTSSNPVDGSGPYGNVLDVILSADPFVAKASDDYRLNTTAGGGAACRGHGVPTSWPGNTLTTSAPDFGASQHADTPVVSVVTNCPVTVTPYRTSGY